MAAFTPRRYPLPQTPTWAITGELTTPSSIQPSPRAATRWISRSAYTTITSSSSSWQTRSTSFLSTPRSISSSFTIPCGTFSPTPTLLPITGISVTGGSVNDGQAGGRTSVGARADDVGLGGPLWSPAYLFILLQS